MTLPTLVSLSAYLVMQRERPLARSLVAATFWGESMEWVKRIGERERECWMGACLARLYQRRGESERARLLAHHYYQVAKQLDAVPRMAELAAVLSSLYIEQQDAAHAREWAGHLNSIAETQNFWSYRVRAAMRLAQVYHLLRQPGEAMHWATRAIAMKQERGQILEETKELYAIAAQCKPVGSPTLLPTSV